MLSKNTFLAVIRKFELLFEFESNAEYSALIYDVLKTRINDKDFLDNCNNILLSTTKDDWNKAYGYKGKPAVADWIEATKLKMIEKTEYYKCDITGAMLAKRVLVQQNQQLKIK